MLNITFSIYSTSAGYALEVGFSEKTQLGIDRIYNTAWSLDNKPRILADSDKEYIENNADFKSYNYLSSLYEKQFK